MEQGLGLWPLAVPGGWLLSRLCSSSFARPVPVTARCAPVARGPLFTCLSRAFRFVSSHKITVDVEHFCKIWDLSSYGEHLGHVKNGARLVVPSPLKVEELP